jgi:hypothetical protein
MSDHAYETPVDPDEERKARLEAIAEAGGPLGIWYRQRLDREKLLGDLETKGANAFLFAGFDAYLKAQEDRDMMSRLDIVLSDRGESSRVLNEIVERRAFEALKVFYGENFGDSDEFQDAFFNFRMEAGIDFMRDGLTLACYEQRLFEVSS